MSAPPCDVRGGKRTAQGGAAATFYFRLSTGDTTMTEQTLTAPKRRRRSAEEKWQIYTACQAPGAKIGEILRAHGMYASELQTIRRTIEAGALEALRTSQPGRKKIVTVAKEDHERLRQELAGREHALAELTVMFTALKKKVNLE
jgi:transposase-like protein